MAARRKPPKYRLRNMPQGPRAYVTLRDGAGRRRDYNLGVYGSQESRAAYARIIAQWESSGRQLPGSQTDRPRGFGPTINELCLSFWLALRQRGYSRGHVAAFESIIRSLRLAYGRTPASSFGPAELATWRATLLKSVSRRTANRYARLACAIWRHGVVAGLVPPQALHSLRELPPLRIGELGADDPPPVVAVDDATIAATIDRLPPQLAAMVRLQRLTGMRSGELLGMTGAALDMSGTVWLYRPATHKTAHRGHKRTVFVGPVAQDVLRPWLRGDPAAPIWPGYSVSSYRRAIARACERAGLRPWHPHQLRHSYATAVRREFGEEMARIMCGHRSLRMTELYAEADEAKAKDVARRIG